MKAEHPFLSKIRYPFNIYYVFNNMNTLTFRDSLRYAHYEKWWKTGSLIHTTLIQTKPRIHAKQSPWYAVKYIRIIFKLFTVNLFALVTGILESKKEFMFFPPQRSTLNKILKTKWKKNYNIHFPRERFLVTILEYLFE